MSLKKYARLQTMAGAGTGLFIYAFIKSVVPERRGAWLSSLTVAGQHVVSLTFIAIALLFMIISGIIDKKYSKILKEELEEVERLNARAHNLYDEVVVAGQSKQEDNI